MPDRLLFVHAFAPPYPGGTPIIVHRLLRGLPPAIELDTVTDLAQLPRVRKDGRVLPGRYHYVPRLPVHGRLHRVARTVAMTNVALGVLAGARAAVIARRRRSRWVLSVADHGFSVVAGDVCSRLARIPHLIWVFDLWEENAYSDADRGIARRLERRLWRRAAAILGHDQELADHYARKHGTAGRVIPTPIELPETIGEELRRAPGATREVLFAGALYWAQEEALRRLARVCRGMSDVRLVVIGDERVARAAGIDADVYEDRLSPEAFRTRVERADVAFIGLSFNSAHPEVIATASPARLPEYMASGTPILVHAPVGSHVAEYARRGGFAEVVDQPDDAALAAGLRRVLDDEAASSMRARRARELALERHDVARVRERLRVILADVATEDRS